MNNNLPTQTDNGNSPQTQALQTNSPVSISGSFGKEISSAAAEQSELSVQAVGNECELPKEVIAAGVSKRPTVVPIPPSIQTLGVKPAGPNVSINEPKRTVLLTDQEIAFGLKQSIMSSWRWFSEWCKRQLGIHNR